MRRPLLRPCAVVARKGAEDAADRLARRSRAGFAVDSRPSRFIFDSLKRVIGILNTGYSHDVRDATSANVAVAAIMNISSFTDFGLRALMRIAAEPDRVHSTADIAQEFGISRNHLTKAVAALANAGFLVTRRGYEGGAQLARPAAEIRLGEVVRALERDRALVECFRGDSGDCRVTPSCRLKHFLKEGEDAFIASLDRRTLAECVLPPRAAFSFLEFAT